MYYITKQTICIKATFEEPIYDHAPSYGSYMQEITVCVPPYTGICLDDKGDVKNVDIPNLEDRFGVSVHRGSIHFYENLQSSIGTILLPVTDADYDKIREINGELQKLEEILVEREYMLSCYEDSDEELNVFIREQEGISQEDYERLSEQLWKGCVKYISSLYEIQRIKERLHKARWLLDHTLRHIESIA